MQLAVDCAGFSPEESDRLRQAMSAKRAPERIEELRQRLLDGMAARGIRDDVAEDVYDKILGFASFGFPESHAQSFAHLVYASAWLKRHHPAAFTAALLRNQPMGFYSPQSLLHDARRHGVTVLPVDVNAGEALPTLEAFSGEAAEHGPEQAPERAPHPHAPAEPQPAIRLGLAGIRGLGKDLAEAIAAGRPYDDMEDLARRVPLPAAALEALATAGAFSCFGRPGGTPDTDGGEGPCDEESHGAEVTGTGTWDGDGSTHAPLSRRDALWAAGALAGVGPGQLPGVVPGIAAPRLPAMTPVEETLAELWATGTSAIHPVAHVRSELQHHGVVPARGLAAVPPDTNVVVAGLVTHRQRPYTAGGIVFMSLEDETGMVNVICRPEIWDRHRNLALDSQALLVNGRLERVDGVSNVVATRLRRLPVPGRVQSRDFH